MKFNILFLLIAGSYIVATSAKASSIETDYQDDLEDNDAAENAFRAWSAVNKEIISDFVSSAWPRMKDDSIPDFKISPRPIPNTEPVSDFESSTSSGLATETLSDLERSPWSALNTIIRKTLSYTSGAVCIAREALEVNAATLKFLTDVNKCGQDVINNITVKAFINICKDIISASSDVFYINENICSTSDETDNLDTSRTTETCYELLNKSTIELKDIIYNLINLPNSLEFKTCVQDALPNFKKVLHDFPRKLFKCAQLIQTGDIL